MQNVDVEKGHQKRLELWWEDDIVQLFWSFVQIIELLKKGIRSILFVFLCDVTVVWNGAVAMAWVDTVCLVDNCLTQFLRL